MNYIRKISVGADYKNGMHYVIGQGVMGGDWTLHAVTVEDDEYCIWIEKDKAIKKWKSINKNTPITIEYNVNF